MPGGDAQPHAAPASSTAKHRRLLVRAIVRALLSVLALVVLYFCLPLRARFGATLLLEIGIGLLVVGAVTVWQIYSIRRARYPRLRAVQAFCFTFPLFIVMFSSAHFMVEQMRSGSYTQPLSRVDALYYTLTVFSTVGFGDITPVSEPARVVTMIQMLGDLVLVAVFARALVGAVQEGLRRQQDPDGAGAPPLQPSGWHDDAP
ncbi:MAG: potassium channel family protein [Jatrophihabitantaceae bacterium]